MPGARTGGRASPAERVAETIVTEVRERWPRPAIVLLHSWPDATPHALELILDGLLGEDAEFLTVDQLDWREAVAGRLHEITDRLGQHLEAGRPGPRRESGADTGHRTALVGLGAVPKPARRGRCSRAALTSLSRISIPIGNAPNRGFLDPRRLIYDQWRN